MSIQAYTHYQSKSNPQHWVRTVKIEMGIVYFAVWEAGVWYEHKLPINKFIKHFQLKAK